MNTENIIKSLNLTEGDVLTLEKAKDRIEFEALPMMAGGQDKCFGNWGDDCNCNKGNYSDSHDCNDNCPGNVCQWKLGPIDIDPCDCVGPSGYISQDNCRPYK